MKENKQTQHLAPHDPSGSDGPLDDGFTLVTNRKKLKQQRKTTYIWRGRWTTTNSVHKFQTLRTHNITLRAVGYSRRANTRRNIEHNRNTKKKCEIFVSNLHLENESSDVMRYLKAEYREYFKIEHIRTQFNGYSFLKIVAPMFLKSILLEKSS